METYNGMEFDWRQMEQIRFGLAKGLDVSVYAKPESCEAGIGVNYGECK